MEYFILDENNTQLGPFSINELESKKIQRSTKVWYNGIKDWSNADTIAELKKIFDNQPPPPPQETNNNLQTLSTPTTFSTKPVYENYFNVQDLNELEIKNYKKNLFLKPFDIFAGLILHFLTLSLFTTIYCGLKYSKLPKIKKNDFNSDRAIGFLFIPFYNFYWIFVFWRNLAKRINLQFKLRNEKPPVSVGLATAVCILALIPYLGGLINGLILMPILFFQIQSATNKLVNENTPQKQYSKVIPLWKFILLSVVTCGIYEVVWFYRQWKLIKKEEKSEISPFWRAFFGPLFAFSLAKRLQKYLKEKNSVSVYSPVLIGISYFVISILVNLPDPYWLISYFTFIPLIPLINSMNAHWGKEDKDLPLKKFNWWQIIMIVIGVIFVLCATIGAFMTEV